MIGIEEFKKYIETIGEVDNYIDKLYDLKIDLINSPIFNCFCSLSDQYIRHCFTKEGVEWVNWWLEKQLNPELKAFEGEEEIPTDTIEDLWNIISKYVKK